MTFLLVYGARFNKRHIGRGDGRWWLMTAESRDEESWQKAENKPCQARHHGYCHRLEWQPLMISPRGNAIFVTSVRVRPASDSSDLDDDVTENEMKKISFTRMALNGCAWLHLIWDQVFGSKSELFCPFVQYLSNLGTRADWRQMADVSQGSRNTTFKSGGNFSSKVHSAPFLCSLELSLAAEM